MALWAGVLSFRLLCPLDIQFLGIARKKFRKNQYIEPE